MSEETDGGVLEEEPATRQDLVDSADRLVDAINGFRAEATAARAEATAATEQGVKTAHRTTRNFWFWAGEAVLAIALATTGILFGVSATNSANEIKQTQYQACVTNNDTRHKVDVVWHVATSVIESGPTVTQKSKDEAAAFLKQVDKIYAPSDCSKLLK